MEEEYLNLEPVKNTSRKRKKKGDCGCKEKTDEKAAKILELRSKGYNDNQIAAMLMLHKEYVQTIR